MARPQDFYEMKLLKCTNDLKFYEIFITTNFNFKLFILLFI